jgi:hypothetical protein
MLEDLPDSRCSNVQFLQASVAFSPTICCCLFPAGYFRGLAHIAGFLLIVMGLDREQEAFWTLAVLLEDKLFPYCGGQVGVVCASRFSCYVHVLLSCNM